MNKLVFIIGLFVLACTSNVKVSVLEFPVGEILQIQGNDTIEYPTFEDAVIISSYDSLTILRSIKNKIKVDGYQFSIK